MFNDDNGHGNSAGPAGYALTNTKTNDAAMRAAAPRGMMS
jgi:hypothetical protein